MKSQIYFLFTVVILFSGCATSTWTHPQYSSPFYRDQRACMDEMEKEIPTPEIFKNAFFTFQWRQDRQRFYDACMSSRGWQRTPNSPKAVRTGRGSFVW